MALSGNLRDFSLPDVFQLVSFSRKTGVLHIIRDDGVEGSIYFKEGEVFFATSNWNRDPLGLRLVKGKQLSQKQLDHALELQKEAGKDAPRLGQILVEQGYISEKTLEAFVQEQIQDTIFDLMRWDEGQFDFRPVELPADEDIGLTVSIENIIMEGSRRLEEWARIKKKIPSLDIVFKMATAPGEGTFEISLKPSEWRLITLVDGTRDVEHLARDLGINDFDVARILYGMYSAGLLEVVSGEELEKLRMEMAKKKARAASEAAAAALKQEEQPEAPVIQLVRTPLEQAEAEAEAEAEVVEEAPPAETPAPAAEAPAAEAPAAEAPAAEAPAAEGSAEALKAEAALSEVPAAGEPAQAPAAAAPASPEADVQAPPAPAEVPPAESEVAPPAEVPPAEPEVAPSAEPSPAGPESPSAQAEAPPAKAEPEAPPPPPAQPEEVPTGPASKTERALSELLAEVDETSAVPDEGFADELSALTGVQVGRGLSGRARPAPPPEPEHEPGHVPSLHRDHSVTKDTLLKIIDGLKKL